MSSRFLCNMVHGAAVHVLPGTLVFCLVSAPLALLQWLCSATSPAERCAKLAFMWRWRFNITVC